MASAGLTAADWLPAMPTTPGTAHSLAALRPSRHFLFLQGMPGPFFRRLARRLRDNGVRVSRVNFNGGDVVNWMGGGACAYRGSRDDWSAWLDDHLERLEATDIVVFGDCRDAHRAARLVADRRGLRFHVFEEGYLRPDHVTLERGGVNGHSSFPRSLRAIDLLVRRLGAQDPGMPVPNYFRHRALQAACYYGAAWLGSPLFPHYRSHRQWPPMREAWGWIRRFLRRRGERSDSLYGLTLLAGRPFFLLPLQLEGDSQLRFCSPFASMREALDLILASFTSAPPEAMLLVKMHPLDPGIVPWRKIVAEIAADAGIADRVVFIERHDLVPLLHATRGVITVNSTVGPLALAEGKPVMALGDAIYRMPGVTADCSLETFWQAPPPLDAANVALLRKGLLAKCLVNGGFHSEEGLDRLVERSVDRLLC
jgi:capsular polysaccharide export protein